MRIKQSQRGISNVIVVMLSLVILVIISANVILWSYQMNQFDWERMQENVEIVDVAHVSSSSWFVTQSEYTVTKGNVISGNYTDTQAVDSSYETFREGVTGSTPEQETLHPNAAGQYANWNVESPGGTAHWDCCDEDPPDDDGSYVQNSLGNWRKEAYNLEDHSGSGTINWVRIYVRARLTQAGTSPIRTLIRTYNTDYESGDISLTTSYQDIYTQYDANPNTGVAWTWSEIDSLQAGASSRKTQGNRNIRMTAVWVVVNYAVPGGYELDVNGTFIIDLSAYPPAYIQTVEIQLRYRANDTGEKWHLKAYNWTATTYSDDGFNSTAGHTPSEGWGYYAVNLADQWSSYVQNDGTMYVGIIDQGPDSNQTIIDIDFLGVRAVINGTRFTFKNEGSLTSHLVSLWIINSTNHRRYDIDVILNSAETLPYLRGDIGLPSGQYVVKVVTERGNIAIFSGG